MCRTALPVCWRRRAGTQGLFLRRSAAAAPFSPAPSPPPRSLGRGGHEVLLSHLSNRERSVPSVLIFRSSSCPADQPWFSSVLRSL